MVDTKEQNAHKMIDGIKNAKMNVQNTRKDNTRDEYIQCNMQVAPL